jgi:outer membrane protein insertion porin family
VAITESPQPATNAPRESNAPRNPNALPKYWRYQAGAAPPVVRGQSPVGPIGQPFVAPAQPYVPPQSGPPVYGGLPAGQQFGGPPPQPGLGPSLNPGAIESIAPPPMEGRVFPDQEPDEFVILAPTVEEARTGRLMFGVGVNSDAGVVGNVVLEEQNFDIMRWPGSWYEIWEGSAFRGAGQRFRIEAVPGTQVQRYMFNFSEPYLFDTPVTFGLSGFLFDRQYRDWTESRMGGQSSLGYQITPDLAITLTQSAEDVEIHGARTPTPQQVLDVLGHTDLYKTKLAIRHDTRDNVFLPTEGHMIELALEQAYGEYEFPRATFDVRQFFLLRQRPDGSGRHVVGVSATLGVTGSNTPVMEHFYAGGTTTLRGFRFRGASPVELGTVVGGEFEFLGSVEYLAPITADDALRAVFFCDYGIVSTDIDNVDGNDFRIAPGFGLRISVPALGPAPIALDLAFPVAHADTDQIQNFSFRVGLFR